jgi:hypothetical protein
MFPLRQGEKPSNGWKVFRPQSPYEFAKFANSVSKLWKLVEFHVGQIHTELINLISFDPLPVSKPFNWFSGYGQKRTPGQTTQGPRREGVIALSTSFHTDPDDR